MRSFNTYIRSARIFSDSNDEEWDNKMETFHYDKINIAAVKIESNKERRSNPFNPERMSIVKKK